MRRQSSQDLKRGFVLLEAVFVVIIVVVAALILIVANGDSRRRARLAGSIENLQQYSSAYQAFSKDNEDRVATFWWRAGKDYGFGGPAPTDLQAASNQAIDIIRRRANRPELGVLSNWVPHLLYNHLVLVDYMDEGLPAKWVVSPGDTTRQAWQRNPVNYEQLPQNSRPFSTGGGSAAARWPYSSSYELAPAFIAPDQIEGQTQTISQATTHNTYFVPTQNLSLGTRQVSEILFPSQKAMMYENVQRFFGPRTLYFAHEEARVPVLMSDGSAGVRATDFCNRGFQPNNPSSPQPTQFNYTPDLGYEPPTSTGLQEEAYYGHMRWCRRGLRGRDFGGAQVP